MPLNRLKQSLPLKTAEFDVSREIDNEPAFKWWVPYTLRRRDRIIACVNKRMCRTTHKHGVEMPTSVAHAKKLDDVIGNTLWVCSINKEMESLKVAFDIIEDGSKIQVGHNKSSGHLVFDVRMSLEQKA